MADGLHVWSQTAASNGNIDSTINAAEGMAPSAVNDSMRAIMAGAAKYRDDNNGSLTTAGTSTAYTLATNVVFASLAELNGQKLLVKFNATNGAAPTLSVDGLGAKAIQYASGSAVATSSILSGSIHAVTYNNSIPAFIIHGGIGSPSSFPPGTIMLFIQTSAPTGWTKGTSLDDHALRVTSGTVTQHAGTAFSSVFAARTITQGNLPNVSFAVDIPTGQGSHGHIVNPSGGHVGGTDGAVLGNGGVAAPQGAAEILIVANTLPGMSGTAASGGSGTPMDFAVKYVDVIYATKD